MKWDSFQSICFFFFFWPKLGMSKDLCEKVTHLGGTFPVPSVFATKKQKKKVFAGVYLCNLFLPVQLIMLSAIIVLLFLQPPPLAGITRGIWDLIFQSESHEPGDQFSLHHDGWEIATMNIFLRFRGYCTSSKNWACFVHYLKIINTVLKNDIAKNVDTFEIVHMFSFGLRCSSSLMQ